MYAVTEDVYHETRNPVTAPTSPVYSEKLHFNGGKNNIWTINGLALFGCRYPPPKSSPHGNNRVTIPAASIFSVNDYLFPLYIKTSSSRGRFYRSDKRPYNYHLDFLYVPATDLRSLYLSQHQRRWASKWIIRSHSYVGMKRGKLRYVDIYHRHQAWCKILVYKQLALKAGLQWESINDEGTFTEGRHEVTEPETAAIMGQMLNRGII